MKLVSRLISAVAILSFPLGGQAGEGHDHKKNEKHCEKSVDGKKVHLDKIKSRKECKQEGGRWVKHKDEHKKGDGHDHGKNDGHKH